MFTGLVLGMGEVVSIIPGERELRFVFHPFFTAATWVKGESIAVNGVCLSIEAFDAASFTAYASCETLRLTNLTRLRQGHRVNLERALALGDRLGGHMVSGHVDGLAIIESIRPTGASKTVRLRFPQAFSAQVLPKGSVTLDGISLTVNQCGPVFLEVNLIPETQAATTAGAWRQGQEVNFESDIIGKYVERLLTAWKNTPQQRNLTLDFLRENGF